MVWLTDLPDMTVDVYRGPKTTMQQQQQHKVSEEYHKVNEAKILIEAFRDYATETILPILCKCLQSIMPVTNTGTEK